MTAVPQLRLPRMTADEFIAWAIETGFRGELVGGEVVAIPPERYAHARLKGQAFRVLGDSISRAGLPCEVIVDGMGVQTDDETLYQPDVILRCGPRLQDTVVTVPDPLVLVEVLSPSTAVLDTGGKLDGYFSIPTVRHYLILRAETRTAIHHARAEDGTIATRILREGAVQLDPPGITLDLADLFHGAEGR
jgi:Uma2 family endonuclease